MPRSLAQRLMALERSTGRQVGDSSLLDSESPSRLSGSTSDEPSENDGSSIATGTGEGLVRLGFSRHENEYGSYWSRCLRYDLLTQHGCARFIEVVQVELARLGRTARIEDVDLVNVRFYDTETTGLATGAGSFPFLHAIGWLEEDEFVLVQYLLADYLEERAMLAAVLGHFCHEGCVVVSYNGKSFDWPLLMSRTVIHQLHSSKTVTHLDLLYPARRLWRQALGSVALGNLEKNVLGLTRVDDLPGKEAPTRYFEYVNTGDVALVEPVLSHNAADVCSLVTLATVMSQVLEGERTVQSAGAKVALGKWHDEWQEYDLAIRCYEEAAGYPDADWRVHWVLGTKYKQLRQWDEAVEVWMIMVDHYPRSPLAILELAKYFEHHARQLDRARLWTLRALEVTPREDEVLREGIRYRLARIERKLAYNKGR